MSISNLDAALAFATKTGIAQVSDFIKASIREAMDPKFESTSSNLGKLGHLSEKQGVKSDPENAMEL
jgi:hypothetical protein